MNTGSSADRHRSSIDNEVTDLPEEVVLVSIPVDTSIGVWIGVDQRNASKPSRSLDCGNRNCIADELCVVELNKRGGDAVSSGREVDKCRSSG